MNIQIKNPKVKDAVILTLAVAHFLALVGLLVWSKDLATSTIIYSGLTLGFSANMLNKTNKKWRTHES